MIPKFILEKKDEREKNYEIGNDSLKDLEVLRKIVTDIPPHKIIKRPKMIYMVNLVKKKGMELWKAWSNMDSSNFESFWKGLDWA